MIAEQELVASPPEAQPRSGRPGPPGPAGPRRLGSLDVVRGAAVAGMLLVDNALTGAPRQLVHSDWHGLTFADTIFPMFLFAVGAAMPFSARAQRPCPMLRRVALLALLGMIVVSLKTHHLGPSRGVLQHIAGAYLLAWMVLRLPRRAQPLVAAGIVAGVWAAFTFVSVGGVVPGSWEHPTNLAEWVDGRLFGSFSSEGTVGMVMSAPNVIWGAVVGRMLADPDRARVLRRLLACAAGAIAVGLLVAIAVPVNKRLWTPSYAVLTHGLSCAWMAGAYWLVECRGRDRWLHPLRVMGANPIAVYVASTVVFAVALKPWAPAIAAPLRAAAGTRAAILAYDVATGLAGWALCAWLYRRRLFLKL